MADTSRKAMAEQYADDRNLAARQSIYRYRRGRGNWFDIVLDLASLWGDEAVADIGCGNGKYLQQLLRRGHRGPLVGLDLSAGMAAQAAAHAPATSGDAQALPFPDDAFDVVLCPHMLYHVPDQAAAVAEVRRVLRADGQALFVTNSVEHFRQVDDLVASLTGARPMRLMLAFTMEEGEAVLRTAFSSVTARVMRAALDVTDPEAVVDYVASVREVYATTDEQLDEIRRQVAAEVERTGAFEITTASGVFVCR